MRGRWRALPRGRRVPRISRWRWMAVRCGGTIVVGGGRVRGGTRPRCFGAVFLSSWWVGAGRAGARSGTARVGWQLTLAAGSLGQPGEPTHAASFFAGIDVHPLDYSPALGFAEPLAAPVPFPPSYEDRPDAPDRVFAAVDDGAYERLVGAWIGRARARWCRQRRAASSAPPDPGERGGGTRLPVGAGAWPPARDRAGDAADDRGGSAVGLALRAGVELSAASLGAAVRPAGRAARGGGGSGPASRPRAGEAAQPPQRRRA